MLLRMACILFSHQGSAALSMQGSGGGSTRALERQKAVPPSRLGTTEVVSNGRQQMPSFLLQARQRQPPGHEHMAPEEMAQLERVHEEQRRAGIQLRQRVTRVDPAGGQDYALPLAQQLRCVLVRHPLLGHLHARTAQQQQLVSHPQTAGAADPLACKRHCARDSVFLLLPNTACHTSTPPALS